MYGLGRSRSNHSETFSSRNGGGEGTEGFAEFDLEIHPLLHVGTACVAQDGTSAEGPRAELHAPLEPAHHAPLVEELGHDGSELLLGEDAVGNAKFLEAGAKGFVRPGRPEAGSPLGILPLHDVPLPIEKLMPCEEGRPIAPPASPAAGCIHRSSKGPSRRMRALATQFRAQPPARQRFRAPVVS